MIMIMIMIMVMMVDNDNEDDDDKKQWHLNYEGQQTRSKACTTGSKLF